MTSVLDGKSFRSGLERIASQAGVNLWLDRQVDPSVLIDAGPVGPTVFAAIEELAETRGCVVMPVADVLLVGRQSWVDHTAATILAIPDSKRGGRIDVAWDDLTTPEDALRSITKEGGSNARESSLPHDLWPAVEWQGLERQVAIALIHAQFETASSDSDTLTQSGRFVTRRYSPGTLGLSGLRQAMLAVDASSRVRTSGDWIVAQGSMSAHRSATRAMCLAAGDASGPDPDTDTFSLEKMTTSAENAFNQLAQAARRTCIIRPEAVEACKGLVSIEGKDVTLRQLIEMAAQQVGVRAEWKGGTIEITMAP